MPGGIVRVAAYRENGKLLGEFCSIKDASRILKVDAQKIIKCIMGRSISKTSVPFFGIVRFLEIDPSNKGQC